MGFYIVFTLVFMGLHGFCMVFTNNVSLKKKKQEEEEKEEKEEEEEEEHQQQQ